MDTHENGTELDVAYWEGRAEEAKHCSAMLAKKNERIAALEAELEKSRIGGNALADELLHSNDKIIALEAQLEAQAIIANAYFDELEPWRQMARQLEELRGEGFDFAVKFEQPDGSIDVEAAMVLKSGKITRYGVGVCRMASELPGAVAVAYGKVVGDE